MSRLIFLFLPSIVLSCTSDYDIITELRRKTIGRDTVTDISLQLNVENATRAGKDNVVFVEGFVMKTWKQDSLSFESRDPCNSFVSVSDVYHPISFSGNQPISDAIVHKNGTVTVKELVSSKENCAVRELEFPQRNMKCSYKFHYTKFTQRAMNINWTYAPSTSQNYRLSNASVDANNLDVSLDYELQYRKIMIDFFLPSLIFMAISWFSLALGPMSITRAILIIGSFVLLIRHFSNVPETISLADDHHISAFVIWKTFSYVFVLLTLVELVFVTCLMSMTKGPSCCCCCCNKHSGEYDFEPIYEELNDLRKRNSMMNNDYRLRYTEKRSSCGCCRICALSLDLITMIILVLSLVAFVYLFFDQSFHLVDKVNNWQQFFPKHLL